MTGFCDKSFVLGHPQESPDQSSVALNITPSLSFSSPDSTTSLGFEEAVTLLININDPAGVEYTASFSSPSGSYQITGLATGESTKKN